MKEIFKNMDKQAAEIEKFLGEQIDKLQNLMPNSERAISKANLLFRAHCDDTEIWDTMEGYLYDIKEFAKKEIAKEFQELVNKTTGGSHE